MRIVARRLALAGFGGLVALLAQGCSLDAPVAGACSVQSSTTSSQTLLSPASAGNELAQSFTATETADLSTVHLYLSRTGTPFGTISVSIQADSLGAPSGTPLGGGSATMDAVDVTTAKFYQFTLSAPASVTSGDTFWIVLHATYSDTSNAVVWKGSPTDSYSGGVAEFKNLSSNFVVDGTTLDYSFKTECD